MICLSREVFCGVQWLSWHIQLCCWMRWDCFVNRSCKSQSETLFFDNCQVSAVSTLVNNQRAQNHLFRNYNLPPSRQSHYPGSSNYRLWEAIRASSAAPGYFEECQLGEWIHQDGGLLTNNPTAIAIHECKQLWPDTPLQCVVSIGTGQYEPTPALHTKSLGTSQEPSAKTSLKQKVTKIVESATDTEGTNWIVSGLFQRFPKFALHKQGFERRSILSISSSSII